MSKSKNSKSDSLSEPIDIQSIVSEINRLKQINPIEALILAEQTWTEVKATKPQKKQVPFLVSFSHCLSYFGRYPESLEIIETALRIKKKTDKKDIELGIVLNANGEKLINLNQMDKALQCLLEAKEIFLQYNDYENQIVNLLDLGRCYDGVFKFREAAESLFLAEELAKKYKHKAYLTRIALCLGNVYSDTHDLNRATKYYKKAAELALKNHERLHYADAMNSISKIYTLRHKYELAIEAADAAIAIYQELNNPIQLSMMYLNMGIILNEAKRPAAAQKYIEKALEKDISMENPVLFFRIQLCRINAYYLQKKYVIATKLLKIIIPIAMKLNAPNLLMPAYIQGYYIYSKQRKWKQALNFYIKAKEEEYVIWNDEKEKQMRELEADFDKIKETHLAEIYKLKYVELDKKNKLISAQKTELEKAYKELDVANKAKTKLFSVIAHDLRGPLGSIFQGIELIADDKNVREDHEFVRNLQTHAFNVYSMTDNLLRWSAQQMDKLISNPQITTFEPILSNVLKQYELITIAKHITIETDIPKNLTLLADAGYLEVILRNLLSNAIKFTPGNGKIRICFKQQNDCYLCEISDNGNGISSEMQKHIFKDKVSPAIGTANESGIGLGLTLVKDFVEQMGGMISLESVVGKGTTFKFSIPVQNERT